MDGERPPLTLYLMVGGSIDNHNHIQHHAWFEYDIKQATRLSLQLTEHSQQFPFYKLVTFLSSSCCLQNLPFSLRLSVWMDKHIYGTICTSINAQTQTYALRANTNIDGITSARKQRSSLILRSVHSPKNFFIG